MTFLTTLRTLALAAFVTLGGLAVGTAAGAATVDRTIGLQTAGNVFKDGSGAMWGERGNVSLSSVASYSGLTVGAYQLTSTDPVTRAASKLVGFCVELTQGLSLPATYTEGSGSALTAVVQERLGRLVTTAWTKVTSAKTAAAFQLAVWETIYDNAAATPYVGGPVRGEKDSFYQKFTAKAATTSVSGVANFDADTINLATQWARLARDTSVAVASVTFLKSAGSQDLLTYAPPATPAPVPLPAAGLALMSGLGAMAALRRRRKAAHA